MQIIDNESVLLRLRDRERVVKHLDTAKCIGSHEVAVDWNLRETTILNAGRRLSSYCVSSRLAKAAKCASTPTLRGEAKAGCFRIVSESRVMFIALLKMGCRRL